MSVSAVSLQEISEARAGLPAANRIVKQPKVPTMKADENYTKKFSDKKIAAFFSPYGYINHERSDDESSVLVWCDTCQIIFDDFTVMAEPSISLFTSDPSFDFNDFAQLCEQSNTTPAQAIADRLEEEVFNPMPYYVEAKKKFVENNLKGVVKNPKYGKLLKATAEKKSYEAGYANMLKQYGSTDIEKVADTLARVIPGK